LKEHWPIKKVLQISSDKVIKIKFQSLGEGISPRFACLSKESVFVQR